MTHATPEPVSHPKPLLSDPGSQLPSNHGDQGLGRGGLFGLPQELNGERAFLSFARKRSE